MNYKIYKLKLIFYGLLTNFTPVESMENFLSFVSDRDRDSDSENEICSEIKKVDNEMLKAQKILKQLKNKNNHHINEIKHIKVYMNELEKDSQQHIKAIDKNTKKINEIESHINELKKKQSEKEEIFLPIHELNSKILSKRTELETLIKEGKINEEEIEKQELEIFKLEHELYVEENRIYEKYHQDSLDKTKPE